MAEYQGPIRPAREQVVDERTLLPAGDLIIRGLPVSEADMLRARLDPMNKNIKRSEEDLRKDWRIAEMYGQVGPAATLFQSGAEGTPHEPTAAVKDRVSTALSHADEVREILKRKKSVYYGTNADKDLLSIYPGEFFGSDGWSQDRNGVVRNGKDPVGGWMQPNGRVQTPLGDTPVGGDIWIEESPYSTERKQGLLYEYRTGEPSPYNESFVGPLKPGQGSLAKTVNHESGHRITYKDGDPGDEIKAAEALLASGQYDKNDPFIDYTKRRTEASGYYDMKSAGSQAAELLADAWAQFPRLSQESPYYPKVGPPEPADPNMLDARLIDQMLRSAAESYAQRAGVTYTERGDRPKIHSGYDEAGLPYSMNPNSRRSVRELLLGYRGK